MIRRTASAYRHTQILISSCLKSFQQNIAMKRVTEEQQFITQLSNIIFDGIASTIGRNACFRSRLCRCSIVTHTVLARSFLYTEKYTTAGLS